MARIWSAYLVIKQELTIRQVNVQLERDAMKVHRLR